MTLFKQCCQVLDDNWLGTFSVPSRGLYPFLWNWDSGFHALGWLHHRPERALIEMETLFSAQWKNGMLPHILFFDYEKYDTYFPSADYWQSSVSSQANQTVPSSGITQPPIHGIVLEKMYQSGLDRSRIKTLTKKAIGYHEYLQAERSHAESGLLFVVHNWESGLDNSVIWDETFARISPTEYSNITFQRKDVHQVQNSTETRPTDQDYKRYLYLLKLLQQNQFGRPKTGYPFLILEPVFNSIYLISGRSLIRLGTALGIETDSIKAQVSKIESSFDQWLWDDNAQFYYPYDLHASRQIRKAYFGNIFPIAAQLPDKELVGKMIERYSGPDLIPIPSVLPSEKGFEEKKYWRGPVWININWMMIQGFLDYDMPDKASWLKEESINLVKKMGLYEYFTPYRSISSGGGYGGKDFSWTSALIMDLIKDNRI
jgi:hypothetical protein